MSKHPIEGLPIDLDFSQGNPDDWRNLEDPDSELENDEDEEAPDYVKSMLGFDPKEFDINDSDDNESDESDLESNEMITVLNAAPTCPVCNNSVEYSYVDGTQSCTNGHITANDGVTSLIPDTKLMGTHGPTSMKFSPPYGHCPLCGAKGSKRERRKNGNDTCEKGCQYSSSLAVHNEEKELVDNYPGQPRDSHGRFGSGAKGSSAHKEYVAKAGAVPKPISTPLGSTGAKIADHAPKPPTIGLGSDKITRERKTAIPKGATAYDPNVTITAKSGKGKGVTKAARIGVPGMEVPPLPLLGRLPNLTGKERKIEGEFVNAVNKDPNGMAKKFHEIVLSTTKPGDPPTFGTDDAKVLHAAWSHPELSLADRSTNRAIYNCALHQAANAITKRAFVNHLDTLKKGDEILVTVGGCGCHARDSLIMMSDGTTRLVQNIRVGDSLMGPDSSPRKVLRLIRGRGKMYRVVPIKGKPFVVNEDHVLALKTTRAPKSKGAMTTVEMTVKEVLARGKTFVANSWLYKTGVEFEEQEVPLDPYFLGIWLGNGCHSVPRITTMEPETVEFLEEFCRRFPEMQLKTIIKDGLNGKENRAKDYQLSLKKEYQYRKGFQGGAALVANPITEMLKDIGVFKNKHIPQIYLRNSREIRLQLLAGLLDTDGYLDNKVFYFSSKSEQMTNEIVYLARSLGFAAFIKSSQMTCPFSGKLRTYYGTSICGEVSRIPTRVARKQSEERAVMKSNGRPNRDVLKNGYHLEELDQDFFYGFTLSGDGLYLMEDFTVTHNSGKGYALKQIPEAQTLKAKSKAVWDSAGDQNATENPWIQKEAEKRGLKVNYLYVSADPHTQWADPARGVVKRAQDPQDGRMVDAHVFADSYALGARNHHAFHQANKDNPSASFMFLKSGAEVKQIPGVPVEARSLDRRQLAKFAVDTVMNDPTVPPHIKRGATIGNRIWGNPLTENEYGTFTMEDIEPIYNYDLGQWLDEWNEEIQKTNEMGKIANDDGYVIPSTELYPPELNEDGSLVDPNAD